MDSVQNERDKFKPEIFDAIYKRKLDENAEMEDTYKHVS